MIHVFALLFGAGILGLLPLQCHRRIRRGFFQLAAALGFLAILIAVWTSPRPLAPLSIAAPRPVAAARDNAISGGGGPLSPRDIDIATGALTIALLLLAFAYVCFLRAGRLAAARAIAWSFLPVAGAALALTGFFPIGLSLPFADSRGSGALAAGSFLAGAGLLGSVTLALLLGHWYLYSPGLPVAHLRRVTTVAAMTVAARFLVFISLLPALVGSTFGGSQAHADNGSAFRFDSGALLESNLPLVAMRFLIGIVFPGILAWMIDRTVRLRSTQAATGLLYVSFIFVLFGELMASYLFAVTGILA